MMGVARGCRRLFERASTDAPELGLPFRQWPKSLHNIAPSRFLIVGDEHSGAAWSSLERELDGVTQIAYVDQVAGSRSIVDQCKSPIAQRIYQSREVHR